MSGRIRSIKPEWLEDEVLVMMSSDARVLTIALILMADDYGNGRCHIATMAGRVFPPSGDSLEDLTRSYTRLVEALSEVTKSRFAGTYEVRGQHYFSIRKWKEHQKVQHPGKPLVPGFPEGFWSVSREPHEVLTPDQDQDQRIDQRPTTNDQRESETPLRETQDPEPLETESPGMVLLPTAPVSSDSADASNPVSEAGLRTTSRDPTTLAMQPRPKLADELFEAYRTESGKTGAKCDGARSQLFLRLAAEGVTVADVRAAVRGAKLDPFARDERGMSANLILSTADQREKYIALARDPPRPKGVKAPRQPNGGGFGEAFCAAAKGQQR